LRSFFVLQLALLPAVSRLFIQRLQFLGAIMTMPPASRQLPILKQGELPKLPRLTAGPLLAEPIIAHNLIVRNI
jgi:hypothetical protein